MTAKFMMHCGGEEIEREELANIEIPEQSLQTETYQPLPHDELVDKALEIATGILSDFTLSAQRYAIARKGNQMFGLLSFTSENDEMGLALAFRNSLDKSMSVGFAAGANVFVCDNLALTGDIHYTRKHTKNVWDATESNLLNICYKSKHNFNSIVQDADALKSKVITNDEAFKTMGLLYGKDILNTKQLSKTSAKWKKPDYEEFQNRNAWSLYNAVTEGLKSSHPQGVLEKYTKAHKFFQDHFAKDVTPSNLPAVTA